MPAVKVAGAVGERQAGVEDFLDGDVGEASGLGREVFDAGRSGDGDEVFGDIAAEIDDDFDVGELGSRRSGAVEDAEVVGAGYEVGYFGIPGFQHVVGMREKEDVECAHRDPDL